jgi:hypothetical protein
LEMVTRTKGAARPIREYRHIALADTTVDVDAGNSNFGASQCQQDK